MKKYAITNKIKEQLETLVLEALLSAISRLTEEMPAMKKEKEMKF